MKHADAFSFLIFTLTATLSTANVQVPRNFTSGNRQSVGTVEVIHDDWGVCFTFFYIGVVCSAV